MIVVTFFLMMYLSFILLSISSENNTSTRESKPDSAHSYLLITNSTTHEAPPPEVYRRVYLGEWSRLSNKKVFITQIIDKLKADEGRAYFGASRLSNDTYEFKVLFYDGKWENSDMYRLDGRQAVFDDENHTLNFTGTLIVLSGQEGRLQGKLYSDCQADAFFEFSSDSSDNDKYITYDMEGTITGKNCSLSMFLEVSQITEEIIKEPKVTYSFIMSCTCITLIFAFAKQTHLCAQSENTAKKVRSIQISLTMLTMNAIIDSFICLWNINLAFTSFIAFDYMMLSAFWSFAVFLVIQGRLLLLVWKAQHPEYTELGFENLRRMYQQFHTKFCTIIITAVGALVFFHFLYKVWISVLHLFFLPQIVLNAVEGYRDSLSHMVILQVALSRLTLVLYIFGCPKNFLVWEPDLWFCGLITTEMALQVGILFIQRSMWGPRFFIPRSLRPMAYSYYRTLQEEQSIEENVIFIQLECIICMTPLNVGTSKASEEVVNPSRTMHTPCGHKYHESCLSNWMNVKMECPTCRAALPVVEI